jgi:hypothetical protein
MAQTQDCVILQSEPAAASPAEHSTMAAWFQSIPPWKELSQITVGSLRKSAAATLQASADALEDSSAMTASKMRATAAELVKEKDVLPEGPGTPLATVEDLCAGDEVFRKGLPAVFIQADHEALIVRMEETGNEISADCGHVSLGVEASWYFIDKGARICLVGLQNRPELNGCHGSLVDFKAEAQRWTVKLDSTGEMLGVNPGNLSALLAPITGSPKSPAPQARLEAGARVRLEGLQSQAQLNGYAGVLLELQPQTKRWNVKLDSTATIVCVHPRNIFLLSAADATGWWQQC